MFLVLVERLEDKSNAVRLAAAEAICPTFLVNSVSWCESVHQIEHIIDSLFIYADDSHDRVSSLVVGKYMCQGSVTKKNWIFFFAVFITEFRKFSQYYEHCKYSTFIW